MFIEKAENQWNILLKNDLVPDNDWFDIAKDNLGLVNDGLIIYDFITLIVIVCGISYTYKKWKRETNC